MQNVPILLNIFFLIGVFLALLFNWVYVREVRKVKEQIGITIPRHLERLLRVNLILPLFTAILILFSLLAS